MKFPFSLPKLPFAKHHDPVPEENLKPHLVEEAFSEQTVLYTISDFEKYNPDGLIGRKGKGIYAKMMLDEQVKAAVRFKRDAITSRRFHFVLDAEEAGISEKEASRRIALFEIIVKRTKGSWIDTLNGIMSAMYNGMSMNEKVHKQIHYQNKTWWGLGAIRLKPFDTFTFQTDEFGNVQQIIQRAGGNRLELDPVNFIHYVVNPDVDEHYGQSELREAYRAYFSKDMAIKFRNIWLERHAGGFRWTEVKEGSNQTLTTGSPEYNALKGVLGNINLTTGAIMPNGIEMKSDYPSHTSGFKEAIDDSDLSIARALLVPPLLGVSPQGNTGSYSQGNIQLEAFFWTLASENLRLEEVLQEQLFNMLGDLNWGDGAYPIYRHKPLSNTEIRLILDTWGMLAEKGVVEHSDRDEDYIRDLLNMPARREDDSAISAIKPDSALQGQQITELRNILDAVAGAKMLPETAKFLIVATFPLSVSQTAELVESIEIVKVDVIAPGRVDPNALLIDQGGQSIHKDDEDEDEFRHEHDDEDEDEFRHKDEDDDKPGAHKYGEESVLGVGVVNIVAFKKAMARVDFAVIKNTSDAATEESVTRLSAVGADMTRDLIDKAMAEGEVTEDVSKNIRALKADPKIVRRMKRVNTAMLQSGERIGISAAKKELDKAKKEAFSLSFDMTRYNFIASDYIETRAFTITGTLTDDYIKIIGDVIMQGARNDKSWVEVEKDIYSQLASKGMVSEDDIPQLLGEALDTDNPDARLRTIVRTNTFDAINTSRHDFFTDPQLDDFVVAFEYSAILDSRTTQICRHLDGDDAGNHSKDWYDSNPGFIPPNHFNCRSLLIPVTQIDTDFVEGPEPSQEPQQGFG